MKTRFRRWATPTLALALAGLVLLGTAPRAHATLTLEAREDGGPTILIAQDGSPAGTAGVQNFFLGGTSPTTVGDNSLPGDSIFPDNNITLGTAVNTSITFGDFSVAGSVSQDNKPGTPTFATLFSNALTVKNNDLTMAHTIDLIISDTGFTGPVNPVFSASANGQFQGLGRNLLGDTAHATAFADFTNALFGMGVTVQDFMFTAVSGTASQSYANDAGPVFPGISTTPYSLTVRLTFTVAAGNQLSNRGDSVEANAAVPEPATLAMAFSALPLIGFAAWRKRRPSA